MGVILERNTTFRNFRPQHNVAVGKGEVDGDEGTAKGRTSKANRYVSHFESHAHTHARTRARTRARAHTLSLSNSLKFAVSVSPCLCLSPLQPQHSTNKLGRDLCGAPVCPPLSVSLSLSVCLSVSLSVCLSIASPHTTLHFAWNEQFLLQQCYCVESTGKGRAHLSTFQTTNRR